MSLNPSNSIGELLNTLRNEQLQLIANCEMRLAEAQSREEAYVRLAAAFKGKDVLQHFWDDRVRDTRTEISHLGLELNNLQYALALILRGVNISKPPDTKP